MNKLILLCLLPYIVSAAKVSKPRCPKEPLYPKIPKEINALNDKLLAAVWWNVDMRDAYIKKLKKLCQEVKKKDE